MRVICEEEMGRVQNDDKMDVLVRSKRANAS